MEIGREPTSNFGEKELPALFPMLHTVMMEDGVGLSMIWMIPLDPTSMMLLQTP